MKETICVGAARFELAMKSEISTLVAVAVMISGCSHQQQLKAKVFERTELNKNRLIIKYKYLVNKQVYIGTASVKNTVISNDSINIIVDTRNFAISQPDF